MKYAGFSKRLRDEMEHVSCLSSNCERWEGVVIVIFGSNRPFNSMSLCVELVIQKSHHWATLR